MSRIKTHVKKGDQVEIIAGNHKGKRGIVLLVNATKGKVTVEGGRPIIKARHLASKEAIAPPPALKRPRNRR